MRPACSGIKLIDTSPPLPYRVWWRSSSSADRRPRGGTSTSCSINRSRAADCSPIGTEVDADRRPARPILRAAPINDSPFVASAHSYPFD